MPSLQAVSPPVGRTNGMEQSAPSQPVPHWQLRVDTLHIQWPPPQSLSDEHRHGASMAHGALDAGLATPGLDAWHRESGWMTPAMFAHRTALDCTPTVAVQDAGDREEGIQAPQAPIVHENRELGHRNRLHGRVVACCSSNQT